MAERPRELDASVNIADVVHVLRVRYGDRGPDDYLDGKTELRNEVMAQVGCSSLEAEEIVDLLEVEGYIDFIPDREPDVPGRGVWHVHPAPVS